MFSSHAAEQIGKGMCDGTQFRQCGEAPAGARAAGNHGRAPLDAAYPKDRSL